MSIQATAWVRGSEVRPPSDKFILFVLADYCNSFGLAYPSVTQLVLDTGYDRKTVFAVLERLKAKGLIVDSGKRVGQTKQVVVYRLPWADIDEESEQSQKRNSSVLPPKQSQFKPKQSQSALENHQKEPLVRSTAASLLSKLWKPRLGKIYGRRESTKWSEKEDKALLAIMPIDDAELTLVEIYYENERKKEKHYCRRDLITLLNNWSGEVDRARAWHGRKTFKKRYAVPLAGTATDEDFKRAGAVARAELERFKKSYHVGVQNEEGDQSADI